MVATSSRWRWTEGHASPRGIRQLYQKFRTFPLWGALPRLAAVGLISFSLAAPGAAVGGNPLAEWTERLFGGRAGSSKVATAPPEGVVVLDLDRPERVRVEADADQRDFPKGRSRYRELELPREYAHVAVRLQVISRPNPEGRGNTAFKPVIYVLDDNGNVRETRDAEPLRIDIRPFRPTRLLACIPLENVRRLALATPLSAVGKYFQSAPRDKIKAPTSGGFHYETNSIKANLPYADTGELVVEVARAGGKGEGC